MKFGSWFEAVQDEPFPRPFPTQSNVGTTSTAEENSTPNFNLQLQVSHEIPQNWGAVSDHNFQGYLHVVLTQEIPYDSHALSMPVQLPIRSL
jgi:hypothetical protein